MLAAREVGHRDVFGGLLDVADEFAGLAVAPPARTLREAELPAVRRRRVRGHAEAFDGSRILTPVDQRTLDAAMDAGVSDYFPCRALDV